MNRGNLKVNAYLEGLSAERRAALAHLRSLVLEVVPDAVETMKYRMPTYEYAGDMLCAFASQKRYLSLYMDTTQVEKHREELGHLDVGKSCIRFKAIEQLPLDTVEAILRETVESRKDR